MNQRFALLAAAGFGLCLAGVSVWAQSGGTHTTAPAPVAAPKKAAHDEVAPLKESLADQVRAVLEKEKNAKPSLVRRGKPPEPPPVITVNVDKRGTATATPGRATLADPGNAPPADARLGRQYQRARSVALTGHVPPELIEQRMAASRMGSAVAGHGVGEAVAAAHWSYQGAGGPQRWDKLNPEYRMCADGKRQSPIQIDSSTTLVGPAEPLQFNYQPSAGTVVNNGHTLQVDVEGDNTLTVRGNTYRLLQFHFHHPAEEMVNNRGFAMVAHLVHRNLQGQLAVVAVLMDPGQASPLIHKVWTYLPLEVNDRVRVPAATIDLKELLPQDQRYYQFMGSLTTPPCSEGVLWMVMKTPATLSNDQLKLFGQLFPNNARPIQALNGRIVREGQ
jgi:carbonic anhydrase